jgi:hypothetical protein
MPALAKKRSIGPNAASAASINATLPASVDTSAATPTAPSSAPTVSSSGRTSASTTRAPAAWKRRARAAPMPRAAPVTTTWRPESSMVGHRRQQAAPSRQRARPV